MSVGSKLRVRFSPLRNKLHGAMRSEFSAFVTSGRASAKTLKGFVLNSQLWTFLRAQSVRILPFPCFIPILTWFFALRQSEVEVKLLEEPADKNSWNPDGPVFKFKKNTHPRAVRCLVFRDTPNT